MGRAGGKEPLLLALEDAAVDDEEPGAEVLPTASELETPDVDAGALVAELDVVALLLLLLLLRLLLPTMLLLPGVRDELPAEEPRLDAVLEEGARNDTAPLDDDVLVEESTWVDVQAEEHNRVIHRQARFMGAYPGGVRCTPPASNVGQVGWLSRHVAAGPRAMV